MNTAKMKLTLRPHGRDANGDLIVMVVGVARVRGPLADVMEWDKVGPYSDFILAAEVADVGAGPVTLAEVAIVDVGRSFVGMGANDILTSGVQPTIGRRIR